MAEHEPQVSERDLRAAMKPPATSPVLLLQSDRKAAIDLINALLRNKGGDIVQAERIAWIALARHREEATADLRAQLEDAQQRANDEVGDLNKALTELETERDALRERLERHVQAVRDIAGVDESRMTAGAVAPGAER